MSERLGEVPEMLPGGRVDFFGVQVERARVGQELLAQGTGPAVSPIMASALTSHHEQIVKVPSLPAKPVSVVSTL